MADTHDVLVIGGGAAGLTAAAGCAMWGLRVALVERAEMGGECLNTGCVPSKALLAAAAAAQGVRDARRFGVRAAEPEIDFAGVMAHVRGAIATIAPHDSPERFEALGCEVVRGEARFVGDRAVEVGGRRLSAPRVVIATGSRPRMPDVPGLAEVAPLTNETLFHLDVLPSRLAVLGGGPVGVEMAQAFRRLGAEVVLLERGRCLAGADRDAAAIVVERLRAEGVEVREEIAVERVGKDGAGVVLDLPGGERLRASHLLVASGRDAAEPLRSLAVERIGLAADADGLVVDRRRRTAAPGVYAVGDCRRGPRMTHAAGRDGGAAALEIALGWRAPVDDDLLPSVVYTDPELAQLGLTVEQARERHGGVTVATEAFAGDDRAIADGDARGFVRTVRAGRRLVGVTIVGRGAGDQLLPWSLVMAGRASTFSLAQTVVAYPTRAERSKELAFARHAPRVFGPAARRWARLLADRRFRR